MIPALIYAVWPDLRANWRRVPRLLLLSLLLGLVGFLPYIYLPLRANAGAAWVYGQPGSWDGFWTQFLGTEAARFIGPPQSLAALWANVQLVNQVLLTDLTAPGLILGLIGLLLALRTSRHRQAAITLLLGGLGAYLFHVLLYSDVLSALILQITLSIAFGWLFLAEWLLLRAMHPTHDAAMGWRSDWRGRALLLSVVLPLALLYAALNGPFIKSLTSNPTGEALIAWAEDVPPDATLMLPWGMRYFAVSFAQDVQGKLPGLRLVDHNADLRAIVAQGRLVTEDTTFYNQGIDWWQAHLGQPVTLWAAGPHMVEVSTTPQWANPENLPEPVNVLDAQTSCEPMSITLTVDWAAGEALTQDWSVFVHLLDDDGQILAQADESAPVYGWRPTSGWQVDEVVRDVYPLPRVTGAARIRYGLYRQLADGSFSNDYVYEIEVNCP